MLAAVSALRRRSLALRQSTQREKHATLKMRDFGVYADASAPAASGRLVFLSPMRGVGGAPV
jgi:hypothetical protein